MDQKNDSSKKICLGKKSVFSYLSSMQRNFWNSFMQRLYCQNCFPELPIAHAVSFLRIFCRKLAQWLLRTYYFLKWVTPSEFPLVGLHYCIHYYLLCMSHLCQKSAISAEYCWLTHLLVIPSLFFLYGVACFFLLVCVFRQMTHILPKLIWIQGEPKSYYTVRFDVYFF